MKIQALGVYGGQLPGKRMTSFLINDEVLVDAGGATAALDLDQQNAIRHILVSHTHVDHIKDIPFLADNVIGLKPDPIDVISAAPVLETLRNHLMNNHLWPDFTVIPTKEKPVLAWREVPVEETFEVGGLQVELVQVNHPVPTYGMFISDGDSTLLYSADTGPTERIWERARNYPNLRALILETSFPDRMAELSLLSGHLSPCHLEPELAKIGRDDFPVYLYHFKPSYEAELEAEVKALGNRRILPLVQGETIEI